MAEFTVFSSFLALGVREYRLHPAVKGGTWSVREMREVAKKLLWKERAAMYDEHFASLALMNAEERTRKIQETKDANLNAKYWRAKRHELAQFKSYENEVETPVCTMTIAELDRDRDVEPAPSTEETKPVDLSHLSDDELETLRKANEISGR